MILSEQHCFGSSSCLDADAVVLFVGRKKITPIIILDEAAANVDPE